MPAALPNPWPMLMDRKAAAAAAFGPMVDGADLPDDEAPLEICGWTIFGLGRIVRLLPAIFDKV